MVKYRNPHEIKQKLENSFPTLRLGTTALQQIAATERRGGVWDKDMSSLLLSLWLQGNISKNVTSSSKNETHCPSVWDYEHALA